VVGKGAQVVGISTDSVETQRKFREQYKLPYTLLSDEGGKVAKKFGGTYPLVGFAHRATFVVSQDGTIQQIVTGDDAIDPGGAITSCPLKKKDGSS
jgi:thioredoxin-dependent peroxiredoxin